MNSKKFFSTILIILGVLLLLSPFISNFIIKSMNDSLSIDDINKSNPTNKASSFNYEAVDDVNIKDVLKAKMSFDKSKIIGLIYIPDINIELPIFKGVSNENLISGIGTMKENQVMGKGNYCLAGHNMKNKDLLFGNLNNIKKGSKVYISDGDYIYEYQISKIQIVNDDDFSLLSEEVAKDNAKISLMTCHGTSASGKRFFAIGDFTTKYKAENDKFFKEKN